MDIQGRTRPRLSKIGVLLFNVQEHSVEYTSAKYCQHTLILIVIDVKAQQRIGCLRKEISIPPPLLDLPICLCLPYSWKL